MAVPIPKTVKTRKPSWLYEDLSWKIILPQHLAAMLVMRYLAKMANDSGRCYASQTTICAVCGGLSTSTIYEAVLYLCELGILTWVRGHGNQYSKDNVSNTYQLHLMAMRRLVKEQGIYDPADNGARLLHSLELTAQVKLLPSLIERSKDSATIAERNATIAREFASIAQQSATIAERGLTPYIHQPSKIQPSVQEPSTKSVSVTGDSLLDQPRGGLPPTRSDVPPSVAPLPSLSDGRAVCAKPVTPAPTAPNGLPTDWNFDDFTDKPQYFPDYGSPKAGA